MAKKTAFITLLFIFLLADAASAQDYIIKLNPSQAEDTTVKNRNFYFDAVIDNREQTKSPGGRPS